MSNAKKNELKKTGNSKFVTVKKGRFYKDKDSKNTGNPDYTKTDKPKPAKDSNKLETVKTGKSKLVKSSKPKPKSDSDSPKSENPKFPNSAKSTPGNKPEFKKKWYDSKDDSDPENKPAFGKSGKSKYLNEINANIAKQVLYEDNHLIAINKLPRQLVQGDESGDECLSDLVKEYIKKKYDKPGDVYLGVIHRLDRPVSGVVIFARTSKALERMNKAFADRKITKTYLAIIEGVPEKHEDTLTDFIAKDSKKRRSIVFNKAKMGAKESELSYSVKRHIAGKTLLEVMPETGRPHQIRVQLAKIGHPIVGDLKYGAKDRNIDRSICLHALSLTFDHPTKKNSMTITAKSPRNSIWIPFT